MYLMIVRFKGFKSKFSEKIMGMAQTPVFGTICVGFKSKEEIDKFIEKWKGEAHPKDSKYPLWFMQPIDELPKEHTTHPLLIGFGQRILEDFSVRITVTTNLSKLSKKPTHNRFFFCN